MKINKNIIVILVAVLIFFVVVVGLQKSLLGKRDSGLINSSLTPITTPVPSGVENEAKSTVIMETEEGQSGNFFLQISSPVNEQKLTSPSVKVIGKTVPGADIFVNDIEVLPDKNGNFSTSINLEEGENPILVSAGNENGDATIERTVYFEKQ